MSDDPHAPAMHRTVPVTRVGRDGPAEDAAAVEEPLEVRLHGKAFAVIMRTPGDDRALAAGFLISEGIVPGAAAIGAIEHCRHPDRSEAHNVVDVYLLGASPESIEGMLVERRHVVTSAACGVCGRVTIDGLKQRAAPVSSHWTIAGAMAADLPRRLAARQRVFRQTGGLHAAGLFSATGACLRAAEDVGRHNAVDKVIGAMLLDERRMDECALAVSGRASFEIVQKAWVAGVPVVCAVSAPSTLAIDLAVEAGITLLGFVRDDGFNIYSHPQRIAGV